MFLNIIHSNKKVKHPTYRPHTTRFSNPILVDDDAMPSAVETKKMEKYVL